MLYLALQKMLELVITHRCVSLGEIKAALFITKIKKKHTQKTGSNTLRD